MSGLVTTSTPVIRAVPGVVAGLRDEVAELHLRRAGARQCAMTAIVEFDTGLRELLFDIIRSIWLQPAASCQAQRLIGRSGTLNHSIGSLGFLPRGLTGFSMGRGFSRASQPGGSGSP
jgi:hypothetical protein